MKYQNNVIELTPYLPAASAQASVPAGRSKVNLFLGLSALVESVVTVGIGVCFLMGLVISIAIAL